MMQLVRNVVISWILPLMGVGFILSGLDMIYSDEIGQTFLCFNSGCIHIQGISSFVLGVLFIVFGLYPKFKNRFPLHRTSSWFYPKR